MFRVRERYKRYREHVSNRLRKETFPTLVIYAIFISFIFLLIAFRGLILAFFLPEVDVDRTPPAHEEVQSSE